MYRKFLWTIILLILVVAGVAIFLLWPRVELAEIKIANGNPSFLFIATEKGFFEEEGLQVKLEGVSPEDSVSALLAGEIDYATFYGGLFSRPFIEASLRNAPIKTIMLTLKHPTYFLVAQPELELNNLKTIGIHSRYNIQHYQTLKFIEDNGLEIEIIAPGSEKVFCPGEELRNLLFGAEVDAILNSFIFYPQPQGFPILETFTYIGPSGLVARNDKIEKNPEEVQKVVRALKRTMEFIVTNPRETKELLLEKILGLEKTKENLQMAEELYFFIKSASDRRNIPADEGAKLLIQVVKAGEFETLQEVEEQIVTPQDLQKIFDFRFVR